MAAAAMPRESWLRAGPLRNIAQPVVEASHVPLSRCACPFAGLLCVRVPRFCSKLHNRGTFSLGRGAE
eukprot:3565433-Prymnesium_polylepis.1